MIWIVWLGLLKENCSKCNMLWRQSNKGLSALDSRVIHMLSFAVSKSCLQNLPATSKKCSKLMIISEWQFQVLQLMQECCASTWEMNLSITNWHMAITNLSIDWSSKLLKVVLSLFRISGQNSEGFQKTLWSWTPCCRNR